MTGPIRADVYLDGSLMASTAAEFYAGDVTVLEGLKVSWGRDTAIDQPDPASLALSFIQQKGGGEFLRSLVVGKTLDVRAVGRVPSSEVANVMSLGTFESLAVGSIPPAVRTGLTLKVVDGDPVTVTRTNYATNPNFEKDTAGWRLEGGAVLTRDPTNPISGSASGFIVGGDVYAQPFPPAAEGDIYTLSLDYRTDGPVTGSPRLHLGQSGGTLVGSKQTALPLDQPVPARFSVSIGPLGVGATGVIAAIFGAPEGVTFDNILIEKAGAATPYFDGNTPDADAHDYAWTGPANASTSIETLPATHTGHKAEAIALSTGLTYAAFAPAAFNAADPTAWDAIPRGSVGETWSGSAWVWANPGCEVRVQLVGFTAPTGASDTYVSMGPIASAPGTGDWMQLELFDVPVEQSGVWMGILVSFSGLAPAWLDTPGTWAEQTGSWAETNRAYVDDLIVEAPVSGTDRTVLVFHGRITDLDARYDYQLAGGSTRIDVTAKDPTADLANVRIGDEPWPVESLGSRVDKILALSGTGMTARVDPTIAETLVTYRDVDSQGAAGLITELAASVAGVAWAAVHDSRDVYYWIEDPRNRVALYFLQMNDATGQVEVKPNASATPTIPLTAHNVLADPIRWQQSVSDIATRADITWLEQGVDDEGQVTTTERHQVTINNELETKLGRRGFSLSTELVSQADASRVASTLLAAQHSSEWRLDGVTWAIKYEDELTQAEATAAMDLLDGTVRIGHSLSITGLPAWVPVSESVLIYIEGGNYVFEDGNWRLELTGSSSGQGTSIKWEEADPTWPWTSFQNLSWLDLIGVGAAPAGTE